MKNLNNTTKELLAERTVNSLTEAGATRTEFITKYPGCTLKSSSYWLGRSGNKVRRYTIKAYGTKNS